LIRATVRNVSVDQNEGKFNKISSVKMLYLWY